MVGLYSPTKPYLQPTKRIVIMTSEKLCHLLPYIPVEYDYVIRIQREDSPNHRTVRWVERHGQWYDVSVRTTDRELPFDSYPKTAIAVGSEIFNVQVIAIPRKSDSHRENVVSGRLESQIVNYIREMQQATKWLLKPNHIAVVQETERDLIVLYMGRAARYSNPGILFTYLKEWCGKVSPGDANRLSSVIELDDDSVSQVQDMLYEIENETLDFHCALMTVPYVRLHAKKDAKRKNAHV